MTDQQELESQINDILSRPDKERGTAEFLIPFGMTDELLALLTSEIEKATIAARRDELHRLEPGSSKIRLLHGDWITVADRLAQLTKEEEI